MNNAFDKDKMIESCKSKQFDNNLMILIGRIMKRLRNNTNSIAINPSCASFAENSNVEQSGGRKRKALEADINIEREIELKRNKIGPLY